MVYIKRIEIRGFKSFKNRTVINLCKGLNVITGPNGSGKSNIVDAIRFALGELNPRMLRVERFSELICDNLDAGSRKAYVKIVLDNGDRTIPIDSGEVEIQRSIDEKGRMIYKINGRRSSREAIVDMLSVAGLSPSAINIVMQGTVTRIADLTPKRRRELLEEIIGISVYDEKKTKAEEELRRAEINFRVAEAKLEAMQEQLDKLSREREQALKYIDLKAKIAKLKVTLLSAKILNLKREVAELYRDYENTRLEIEKLLRYLESLKAERKSLEDELVNLPIQPIEADSLTFQLSQLREAKVRLEETLKSIDEEIASIEKMRENMVERLSNVEIEIRYLIEKIEKLSSEENALVKALDEKRAEYRSFFDHIGSLGSHFKNVANDIVRLHNEYVESIAIYSQLRSSILECNTKLSVIEEAIKARDEMLKKLDDVKLSMERQIESIRSTKLRLQEVAAKLLDELQTLLSKIKTLEDESKKAYSLAYKCGEIVSYLKAQLETIDRLVNIQLLSEAINRIIRDNQIPGVYGLLHDSIKFKDEFKIALESVAGVFLYAVIVKDINSCLICLDKLKNLGIDKAIVIPLSDIKPTVLSNYPSIDGVLGLSLNFVDYPPEFKPVVDLLFGNTLIVSDRRLAIELSNRGFRSVTIEGELYEPEGPIKLGSFLRFDHSKLLVKSKLLSTLIDLSKRLEKALTNKSESYRHLVEEYRAIRRRYIELEKWLAVIDVYQNILERELIQLNKRRDNLEKNIAELRREHDQLINRVNSERKDIRSFERKLNFIAKQLSEISSKIISSNIDEKIFKKFSTIAAELSSLEEALLKVRSEKSMLQGKLGMLGDREYATLKAELDRLSEDASSLQNRRRVLEEQLKNVTHSIERIESDIRSRCVGGDSRTPDLYERLSVIRREMEITEESYRILVDRLRMIEAAIHERKAKLELMEVELRKLGFEEPIPIDNQDISSLENLIVKYETEIETLGSVNLLSVDEYEDVKRRYDELAKKVDVLREEKLSIEKFIEEIENEKKRVFMEFLDRLNSKLREVFGKFTSGGDAWLEPEDRTNIFNGGIDLITAFPGKPRRSLSIASGGEKTIAALSFIFALSKLNPTTVYILDEVDAHLDPVNLERLASALKDLSSESQIIVVSLKDVIASKADKIYGIYSRGGLSKVVAAVMSTGVIGNG